MSEEKKVSAEAGSTNGSANDANAGKPGDASNNEGKQETVSKQQYDELFSKMGEHTEELGNLRKIAEEYESITPFLEKVNQNEPLIKAILDDKLSDPNLIKAIVEGTVSITDAKKIEKANEKVKEELGKKEYEKSTPEQISKMIEEKLEEKLSATKELEKKISSMEEERILEKYEMRTQKFIDSHKDFAEYATDINKYMEDNNILDVNVAYDAVVGKKLQEKMAVDAESRAKEEAKEMASNMGGGGSMRGKTISDKKLVDELIAS